MKITDRNLVPMSDFVVRETNVYNDSFTGHTIYSLLKDFKKKNSYADLLHQGLKLNMFVPCDEEGNAMENKSPHHKDFTIGAKNTGEINDNMLAYKKKQQKAKETVLFFGYSVIERANGYTKVIRHDEEKQIYIHESGSFTWSIGGSTLKTVEDLTKRGLKLTKQATDKLNKSLEE